MGGSCLPQNKTLFRLDRLILEEMRGNGRLGVGCVCVAPVTFVLHGRLADSLKTYSLRILINLESPWPLKKCVHNTFIFDNDQPFLQGHGDT